MGDRVDGSDTKKERKKKRSTQAAHPRPTPKNGVKGWLVLSSRVRQTSLFLFESISSVSECVCPFHSRGGGMVLLICFIIRKESNEQAKNNKKGNKQNTNPMGINFHRPPVGWERGILSTDYSLFHQGSMIRFLYFPSPVFFLGALFCTLLPSSRWRRKGAKMYHYHQHTIPN